MKYILALLLSFSFLFADAKSTLFSPLLKPLDYDKQKALLGKELFNDKRISADKKISCRSCHSTYETFNKKHGKSDLNPPSILNSYLNYIHSFDGKITNLKEKINLCLTSGAELKSDPEFIVKQIKRNPRYAFKFKRLYKDGITYENAIDAIIEFLKATVTPNSKFDKFIAGDENALSQDEKDGFDLFMRIGCVNCHNGVNLGGNIVSLLGYEGMALKVPSLRNVSLRSVYLHNGTLNDLLQTIEFMNERMNLKNFTQKDYELLYKFLLALTGEFPEILHE
ncbi:cytochrome-c peroxidase [Campylobacter hyointestinalis]|uniref:cytochrome-c peroxidase n=1 Tax=Campylobacter hyointestinalis TaxID=198 RepID=UPI000CE41AC3|nr:cytochrome c peroxidase [Campylobacter hyointestinalis]PPB74405.1 cytochrome-c peroxidase [Campylobacter hyointestinalis subsp. hyointestinalis]PPB74972.1 cytochrome-c peroxidase [Campylobacter hyointestinalis subsp. hyointestinalis]PPB77646.1 cytochrome-c peroxidase [Campylobacter hyointestinalis subsp. hyointestinalis]PPB78764.1 cytochrome-c peroxidase [Campylobacter hyointestinalis subsp. hyointestinalis]